MSRGILYVTGDDDYLQEAIQSAESAKKVMPDIDIGFITDWKGSHPIVDEKLCVDLEYSFQDKVQHLSNSPFDKTIYVDTDVYFSEPVNELFDILDKYSIAAAHAPQRMTDRTNAPDPLPELNTGVIAYNLPECNEFFSSWLDKYQSLSFEADQPSFRKVFYETDLRTLVLPPEYNCRSVFPGYLFNEANIIHGRHNTEMKNIEKKLNQSKGMRLHYPVGHGVKLKYNREYNYCDTLSNFKSIRQHQLKRSYEVLEKDGLKTLIRKIYQHLMK